MAYLNPDEASAHVQASVLDGVKSIFPIKGRTHTLQLDAVHMDATHHIEDVRSQLDARMNGKTWATPLHATLSLTDNETGKVVDTKKMHVADIPKMTKRFSYIIDGQEYQVDNQWQLKPGVYARRRPTGELETRFNVTGRSAFDMKFDPAKKQFTIEYKKAKNIPAYPLMKALGVDDDALEKSWGKDIFLANKNAKRGSGAVEQFYKTSTGKSPTSHDVAVAYLQQSMQASKLRPEVTSLTLGKPFEYVTGDTLHLASKKLLAVQGGAPEDDRDSLVFKTLRSTGDFIHDQLVNSSRNITDKVQRQLNTGKTKTISAVMRFDMLNTPVRFLFTKTAISNVAKQINPLEMAASAMQTTLMGPGGIKSDRTVTDEAKMINVSHIGFLDPINTPEGEKTGVTLRLPVSVIKDGGQAKIPVYGMKTGKRELITPEQLLTGKVVLPDQIHFKGGVPHPVSPMVSMVGHGNNIEKIKFTDADYVMYHPSQLFNLTSNLIPFMGNNSGGRAGMASRHMEQAISLVNREVPIVQVAAPENTLGIHSFERAVGNQTAHLSPVTGTIHALHEDAIIVRGKDGKDHEVQTYNNYPLNDAKSVLHSTPVVKVGQKVTEGQLIADTNYTKEGHIALGTNLRVAYLPYKGLNFEDGIVISESAAQKKLTSMHLHKHSLEKDEKLVHSVTKFKLHHPGAFKPEQYQHLDTEGVVHVGTKVNPGDPLIIAMSPYELKDRTGVAALRKSLTGQHTDRSVRWDSDTTGEVVGVHKGEDKTTVHIRTIEPMQVGDKMAGRYGNKGVVVRTLPDAEMPHDKDGKPMEVLLSPSGVPGRMNVGQVLETAASKIAKKTGQPYIVQNFDPDTSDYSSKVKKELKQHGLSDTEELFDPTSKHSLGQVLTGHQYMMKLVHQVDKKISARSGMQLPGFQATEGYDSVTLQPGSGGGSGGQSIGALGMYALLAHGAKANIREMQTWKSEGPDIRETNRAKQWSSQHLAVWKAIQEGTPIPTPKSTFAFQKFTDMLTGAGINVQKKGHEFIVTPLTDKHILNMSAGELKEPSRAVIATKFDSNGHYRPIAGGLFDEKITGGHYGTKWSHVKLAEPLPNPVFETAIKSLTGLTRDKYLSLVQGESAIHPITGKPTELSSGITGGQAIKTLLDKLDVDKELDLAKKKLTGARVADVDRSLKKVKYLTTLKELNLTPSDAYVLHNLPILPPVSRPISMPSGGALKYEDLNGLYMSFALLNNKLKDPVLSKNLTAAGKKDMRSALYDGAKAIMGIGTPEDSKQKGLLEVIHGNQPKEGFFQKTLMNRRQDLTMRSTIVPEPSLGLDEIGLPKDAALTLFRPFVVRQLVRQGSAQDTFAAQHLLADQHKGKNNPMVWRALAQVMSDRPVLFKRDPALHKYSVQGFKSKMVHGDAIQIHPLVTGGFNADFDGDAMSVFVPISQEAVAEAHKMFPSNNIFNEASGKVMYQPTLESALGIYKLSLRGKDTKHTFSTPAAAAEALKAGTVHYTDVVHVDGVKTTPGRVLLAHVLPAPMQKNLLKDIDTPMAKKGLDKMLTELGTTHRHEFGRIVDRIKDIGFDAAFGVVRTDLVKGGTIPVGAHTLNLNDFTTDTLHRDSAMASADAKASKIRSSSTPARDKDRQIVEAYLTASSEMDAAHKKHAPMNNLRMMTEAGVKPSWDQYKQMVLAPVVMKDSKNHYLPTPVGKSYSEGLDMAGYWTQMHGARRGAVLKVQEVQEPGYMSKLLMNTAMNLQVDKHDCGTTRGITLPIDEPDIHDRHLAADVKIGHIHLKTGELLTPDKVALIRSADKDARILVRSALKCESDKGICQKCLGPSVDGGGHPLGTNIGVLASHALGERSVQITLKAFHEGGVASAGGGSRALNSFARFQQLTKLPTDIADAASLAAASGKVDKVEHGPTGVHIWIGDHAHFIGKDVNGMALHTNLPNADKLPKYIPWKLPTVGTHFDRGDVLSDPNRTLVNPHDLYRTTKSMDRVQNFLADEIHYLYKDEGVRRRAIETVVKAMSNLTKVEDPGDHPHVLRGEFYPTTVIQKMNGTELKGKRPIEHKPVLKGVDMLPLSLTEDWMAKLQHQRLTGTITEAAAIGASSAIHGGHPIPGIAFGAEFGLPHLAKPVPGRAFNVQPFHH